MKRLILIVLLVAGCAGSQQVGGWCYLKSGLYLADTDVTYEEALPDWPPVGHVEDVFDTYNDNPNRELFYQFRPAKDELWSYQFDGFRVVVVYWNKTMYHARPMAHMENIEPYMCYVSWENVDA